MHKVILLSIPTSHSFLIHTHVHTHVNFISTHISSQKRDKSCAGRIVATRLHPLGCGLGPRLANHWHSRLRDAKGLNNYLSSLSLALFMHALFYHTSYTLSFHPTPNPARYHLMHMFILFVLLLLFIYYFIFCWKCVSSIEINISLLHMKVIYSLHLFALVIRFVC